MPTNVEAKLREVAAACDVPKGNIVTGWPDWFRDRIVEDGTRCWHDLLKEAADELEQRSLYAGRLLRRLAGD